MQSLMSLMLMINPVVPYGMKGLRGLLIWCIHPSFFAVIAVVAQSLATCCIFGSGTHAIL
jgi:hypothetical protein